MEGVTVILTTYNGKTRGFLEEAILSVLQQSHPLYELVIVDDGSTDGTEEICKKYLNRSVTYLKKKNGGVATARNLGIEQAKYSLISFLDDDDLFDQDMLASMVNTFLEQKNHHKNLGIVYCAAQEIDSEKNLKQILFPPYSGKIYEQLLYGNFMTISGLLVHKKVFEKVGNFRDYLRYIEDYDFSLRVAQHFEIVGCNDILVFRRVHPDQLSSNPQTMQVYHRLVLEKNWSALENSKKQGVLFAFHMGYARIFLGQGYFSLFRKELRAALDLGKVSLKWKIKYFLSYFPSVFNLTSRLIKKTVPLH